MVRLTFVLPQGERVSCVAQPGSSVMEAALVGGIDAVLAECGGTLACGTCHVYVEASQLCLLDAPSDAELQMLEAVAGERRPNSRLSCQLQISDRLDGLILHAPQRQT